MKTIYILRHAKSSWDFSHLNDVERPLIEKGINRTNLIARYLNKNNITPRSNYLECRRQGVRNGKDSS
jgi:phosphohistidine phosphatase SixA